MYFFIMIYIFHQKKTFRISKLIRVADKSNKITKLDDIERQVVSLVNPGMRPDQVAKQMDIVQSLMQSIQDLKTVTERINKTGGALLSLIEDDAEWWRTL